MTLSINMTDLEKFLRFTKYKMIEHNNPKLIILGYPQILRHCLYPKIFRPFTLMKMIYRAPQLPDDNEVNQLLSKAAEKIFNDDKNFHIDIIQSRNLTTVAGDSVIQYQPTDGTIDLSLKHYLVIEKV